MEGMLAEIGYANALLARELPDGELQLIDGHLRAETTPDMDVPVLILDLSEAEANALLALHDPLAALADTNAEMLNSLVAEIEVRDAALREMLQAIVASPDGELDAPTALPTIEIPTLHQVVVECDDESEQQRLYERLCREGLRCRVLTL